MGVAESRRLKQFEDENAELKRLVADLTLDKTMLHDVRRKSGEARPSPGDCVPYADGIRGLGEDGLRGDRLWTGIP